MGKVLIPTLLLSLIAVVMVLGSASPVLADSGETKSYKKHWAIPIGESVGTLEITDAADKDELKKNVMPLDEVVVGYSDIHKAKLGKAVNDDGKYFLVWKLVSYDHDSESDAKMKTIYVLDAATGEPLADPITREGGSCGGKDKSQTRPTGSNA